MVARPHRRLNTESNGLGGLTTPRPRTQICVRGRSGSNCSKCAVCLRVDPSTVRAPEGGRAGGRSLLGEVRRLAEGDDPALLDERHPVAEPLCPP